MRAWDYQETWTVLYTMTMKEAWMVVYTSRRSLAQPPNAHRFVLFLSRVEFGGWQLAGTERMNTLRSLCMRLPPSLVREIGTTMDHGESRREH